MHVERRLIEMGSSPLEAGRQECESLQRLCHLQFVGPAFDEVVAAFQDPKSQAHCHGLDAERLPFAGAVDLIDICSGHEASCRSLESRCRVLLGWWRRRKSNQSPIQGNEDERSSHRDQRVRVTGGGTGAG